MSNLTDMYDKEVQGRRNHRRARAEGALSAFKLSSEEQSRVSSLSPPASNNLKGLYQRKKRNAAMYKQWNAADWDADSREEVLRVLSERYALSVGRVRGIVEKIRADEALLPVEERSGVEGVRNVRADEAYRDAVSERVELLNQLSLLESKREKGEKWIDVEQTEELGEEDGGPAPYLKGRGKVKRVSIEREIHRLYGILGESHQRFASSLNAYKGAPAVEHRHTGRVEIGPSEELAAMIEQNRAVEADVEVIKEQSEE